MPGEGLRIVLQRGDEAGTRAKVQGGLRPTRHTLPAKPNVGGKSLTSDDPKASSTEDGGRGGLGPGPLA